MYQLHKESTVGAARVILRNRRFSRVKMTSNARVNMTFGRARAFKTRPGCYRVSPTVRMAFIFVIYGAIHFMSYGSLWPSSKRRHSSKNRRSSKDGHNDESNGDE
jgi:hypothetical protein